MMRFLLLLIASFALTNCEPTDDPAAGAKAFKSILVQTIREADEIRIVEYPNPNDDPEAESNVKHRSSTLDEAQRKHLEQLVVETSPTEKNGTRACFIPHHSIRFFKNGTQNSELQVCLECSELRLSSTHFDAPEAMLSTISGFMETLGYRKLTPEEKQSRTSQKSGTSPPLDIPAQSEPPEAAKDK